jgi:DNA damage-binding protein 1
MRTIPLGISLAEPIGFSAQALAPMGTRQKLTSGFYNCRKANRLEFYTLTPDGLTLAQTRAVYAQVTMLARLPAPANSTTDHLFVGTDQYNYFTLAWDPEKRKARTARSYVDIAEPSARESQTDPRCLVDPSGRFMTLEIYEGVIVVIPIIEPTKRKGRASHAALQADAPQVGELGEPTASRIDELFVRSSAFLHSGSNQPWLALLYEDNQKKVRLRIRELEYSRATSSGPADATFKEVQEKKLDGGVFAHELDMGSTHLIPIPAPLGTYLFLCLFLSFSFLIACLHPCLLVQAVSSFWERGQSNTSMIMRMT